MRELPIPIGPLLRDRQWDCLEHVRDHQNPLAHTPALALCQAPQLCRPRLVTGRANPSGSDQGGEDRTARPDEAACSNWQASARREAAEKLAIPRR